MGVCVLISQDMIENKPFLDFDFSVSAHTFKQNHVLTTQLLCQMLPSSSKIIILLSCICFACISTYSHTFPSFRDFFSSYFVTPRETLSFLKVRELPSHSAAHNVHTIPWYNSKHQSHSKLKSYFKGII